MILAIVQARMGSSRFPNKVLAPVLGKPMLQWQIERLRACKQIDRLVVATTNSPSDLPLVNACAEWKVDCVQGSESDVLERFLHAAKMLEAPADSILVRLTGDCPLVDPVMVDEGIVRFKENQTEDCRYQGYHGDLPDGMDFEIFTLAALEEAAASKDPFDHEHVTPFLWKNPKRFGARVFEKKGITPGLRFSVDYPEDRDLVEAILVEERKAGGRFGVLEISELLKSNAELRELNSRIIKNEGLIKSALESPKMRMRLGVLLETPADTSTEVRDLKEWGARMGIEHWESAMTLSESAGANWEKVGPELTEAERTRFARLLDDPTQGIWLIAKTRTGLARLLMFAFQERFL